MNALEGKQHSVSIILSVLGASVGTNQGTMVEGSLHEIFNTLPNKQKRSYLKQMRDKLQEGSQITLPDADSKPGTILCKAIFVKKKTDAKVLVEDMRALSKKILNTKNLWSRVIRSLTLVK